MTIAIIICTALILIVISYNLGETHGFRAGYRVRDFKASDECRTCALRVMGEGKK